MINTKQEGYFTFFLTHWKYLLVRITTLSRPGKMLWSAHEEYVSEVISNKATLGDKLELEIRIGYWSGKTFCSSVRYPHYRRLIEALKSQPGVVITAEHIESIPLNDGYRKRIINYNDIRWERKIPFADVSDIDDKSFLFRLSFMEETQVEPLDESRVKGSRLIRSIDRTKYVLPGYPLVIDVSKVTSTQSGMPPTFTYEIELEMIKPVSQDKVKSYFAGLEHVLKLMYGTEILYEEGFLENGQYPRGSRRRLNRVVNDNMITGDTDIRGKGGAPLETTDAYIDRRILTEARNLKIVDMRMGGLVGGKWKMTATDKTDGKRMMLIVSDGIWLVFPPYECNLLVSIDDRPELKDYGLTILDGELIPKEKRLYENGATDAKYWLQVLDGLFINGVNIQKADVNGRFQEVAKEINRLRDSGLLPDSLHLSTKNYNAWDSVEGFFDVMSNMLAEQRDLPYATDGITILPVNHKYMIYNWDRSPDDRKLTKLPDIIKWKPPEQTTIDFEFRHDPAGTRLYSEPIVREEIAPVRQKGRQQQRKAVCAVPVSFNNVLFTGTEDDPFDYNTMVVKSHPLTDGLPNEVIVEYAWKYEEGPIEQKLEVNKEKIVHILGKGNYLYPVRIRDEKAGPNRLDVAQTNWDAICRPITIDDITGRSVSLMFRYHGEIKWDVYNAAKPSESSELQSGERSRNITKPRRVLLELGPGKGGDARKWVGYDYLILVEPDEDIDLTKISNRVSKLVELEKRAKQVGFEGKYLLLKNRAQDTNIIVNAVKKATGGRGVDTISMMFSLTFFWESLDTLRALAATINGSLAPGGKFIWATLDGDRVRQIFSPVFGGIQYKRLEFGPMASIEPEFLPNTPDGQLGEMTGKIVTTLPGIVGKQVEYLTSMPELEQLLEGFEPATWTFADKAEFLPENAKTLSKLYSYGIWRKKISPSKTPVSTMRPIQPISTQQLTSSFGGLTLGSAAPQQRTTVGSLLGSGASKLSIQPASTTMSPSLRALTGISLTPQSSATIQFVPSEFISGAPGTISLLPSMSRTGKSEPKHWFDNVVKIQAHGDGSCLIHSVLLCISEQYRRSNNKVGIASNMRRDLADWLLSLDATRNDGAINWETAGRGQLMTVFSQQLGSLADPENVTTRQSFINYYKEYVTAYQAQNEAAALQAFNKLKRLYSDVHGKELPQGKESLALAFPPIDEGYNLTSQDYSPAGLFSLYNSLAYLGDEVIGVLPDILGIDIYVIQLDKNYVTGYAAYSHNQRRQPSIAVIYTPGHYDAVGVTDPLTGHVQTVFPPGQDADSQHPFVTALRSLYGDLDPYNEREPDPNDVGPVPLIELFIEACSQLAKPVGNRMPDIVYRCLEGNKPNKINGIRFPQPFLEKMWTFEVELKAKGITNTPTDYYLNETLAAISDPNQQLRNEIIQKNCFYIARMSSDKEIRELVDLSANSQSIVANIVATYFPALVGQSFPLTESVPWAMDVITKTSNGNITGDALTNYNILTRWIDRNNSGEINQATLIVNEKYNQVQQELALLLSSFLQ